jgi:beta-N-acetylhexosaminidase
VYFDKNIQESKIMKCYKIILGLFFILSSVFSQDLRSKIGQMIMVGYYSSSFEDTMFYDISYRNLGGVILFSWNINNPQQLQSLTNQFQGNASTPLFISTDQEGGYIARLNGQNGYDDSYSHYTLGTTFNSEDSTRNTASQMAQWLQDAGININLAPVVDVNVNPTSPAIGAWDRSFSSDPMTVFNHASWFIDEFSQKNVFSSLKHFPGHGSAIDDSHLGFTNITHTWADSELVPYQQLIGNGYSDLVMIGHLYNANIDSLYPASLSYKTITSLLKDSLGFNGLVITDALNMGAITNNYSFGESIELAINAGADILLYADNRRYGQSIVKNIIDTVEYKVNMGLISQTRIDSSYQKIINSKQSITSLEPYFAKHKLPLQISLKNYPNPFNSGTTIEFVTDYNGLIDVKIFNILGQVIKKYAITKSANKNQKYYFNTDYLQSGVYFVHAQISNSKVVKKITCLK